MSTSSCPQCGKQVTIPSGVGTSAKVRCPLCHSQYTLADALVNMPPLLELVDDAPLDLPDGPTDDDAGMATVEGGFDATLDLMPEVAGEVPSPALPGDAAESIEALDEGALDLETSPGHDDLTVEEKDTVVEDLGFSEPEPLVSQPLESETSELADAAAPAEAEEGVFDFGEEMPQDTGTELDEVEDLSDAGAPAGDEMALDFGEPAPQGASSDDDSIQFDDPLAAAPASEEPESEMVAFDEPLGEEAGDEFAQAMESGESPGSAADDDEIGLDLSDSVEPEAQPVLVTGDAGDDEAAAEGDPKADKKKKKKEKKAKKQKAKAGADGEARPRRPLSTVLSVVLGAVVALPLALYLMLWLGPDYDFLGLGPMLPKAVVPKAFHQPTYANRDQSTYVAGKPQVSLPTPQPDVTPEETTPGDEATPEESMPEDAAPENNAADATSEPGNDAAPEAPAEPGGIEPADAPPAETERMPDEGTASPADATEPPSLPPADEAPAARVPSGEEPAAEAPAESPATDPLADLLPDTTTPEAMPDEPPGDAPTTAPEPAQPAEDPFSDAVAPDATNELPSPLESPAPAEAEPVGPVKAAAVSPDELGTAIATAQTAARQMAAAQASASPDELKRARSNFYLSFFRLAEAATFAKDETGGGQLDAMRQQIERFLRQFSADASRLDALKFNAGRWLTFSRRTTPGIMLVGKVESAEPVGKLYEVKLAIGLEADAPVVTVLAADDPALLPGDQAFVLGSIVDNPAEGIAGYEGSEPTAVWSGMALKLKAGS